MRRLVRLAHRGVRDEPVDPLRVTDGEPVAGGPAPGPGVDTGALDAEVVEERGDEVGLRVDSEASVERGAEVAGARQQDRRDAVAGQDPRHESGGVDAAGAAVHDDDRCSGARDRVLDRPEGRLGDLADVLVLVGARGVVHRGSWARLGLVRRDDPAAPHDDEHPPVH